MTLNDLNLLLGTVIRILVDDGRLIEGDLSCMDKDLNFILGNATEYHGVTEDHVEDSVITTQAVHKYIGNAMVPGIHVKRVFGV